MIGDETVPFGKYKGRPVADMLADADYMTWLEAQPWFRQRYAGLVANRDAEAASRTPVHNRLQASFLDAGFCRAFVEVASPEAYREAMGKLPNRDRDTTITELAKATGYSDEQIAWLREGNRGSVEERIAGYERQISALGSVLREISDPFSALYIPVLRDVRPAFEVKGCDVCLYWEVRWNAIHLDTRRIASIERYESSETGEIRIEVKPTVADEYPAVLRQMARNKSSILFLEEYCGEGVTEDQFRRIFAASNKDVVFKRDVDVRLKERSL